MDTLKDVIVLAPGRVQTGIIPFKPTISSMPINALYPYCLVAFLRINSCLKEILIVILQLNN